MDLVLCNKKCGDCELIEQCPFVRNMPQDIRDKLGIEENTSDKLDIQKKEKDDLESSNENAGIHVIPLRIDGNIDLSKQGIPPEIAEFINFLEEDGDVYENESSFEPEPEHFCPGCIIDAMTCSFLNFLNMLDLFQEINEVKYNTEQIKKFIFERLPESSAEFFNETESEKIKEVIFELLETVQLIINRNCSAENCQECILNEVCLQHIESSKQE